MRIVYLDEAGTSKKDEAPFIVVAGVVVHGDHQLRKLREELRLIQERHIPETDRDSLVLHACDIYGGNKYFDTKRKPEWTYERRMAILADLAQLPGRLNLYVTLGLVPRDQFPYTGLAVTDAADFMRKAIGATYMSCLIEVDQWFREHARQENCFIVVEDNRDTRQFIKETQQYHQGSEIAKYLNEKERQYFPLKHIQEDPNFQEKRVAHPLVLADFIAYFVTRRLRRDARAMRFSDAWWHDRSLWPRVRLPSLEQE